MRVRAGARACARGSSGDFDLRKWFLGNASLVGIHTGDDLWGFLTFGKTCKILQACIHVLVKLIFRIREKHKFWIISNGYVMRRNWRDEKISTQKSWLFRNEWSSFDRLLQPELLTTRGSGSWRSPIVNQKTLIDLGSHSPQTKFYSLQHQLLELDLARLTFFGVRYVLTYSPNHFSAQDVKHLDHQCDSLWSTEVTYEDPSDEACATMQYLSVPLRKSDYLPWDTGLTILAIHLKLLWNPIVNSWGLAKHR